MTKLCRTFALVCALFACVAPSASALTVDSVGTGVTRIPLTSNETLPNGTGSGPLGPEYPPSILPGCSGCSSSFELLVGNGVGEKCFTGNLPWGQYVAPNVTCSSHAVNIKRAVDQYNQSTLPGNAFSSPGVGDGISLWGRNYQAPTGAFRTGVGGGGTPALGGYDLAINYTENKSGTTPPNGGDTPYDVLGSANPYCARHQIPARSCGTYTDYRSFITESRNVNSASTYFGSTRDTDLGPIIWPTGGYGVDSLNNNQPVEQGLAQPETMQSGNYRFVYYVDESADGAAGTEVHVARSPISGDSAPGTWEVEGSDYNWYPALPPGFSASNSRQFLNTGIDQNFPFGVHALDVSATGGFGPQYGIESFAVAHVKGTFRYIAVEKIGVHDDTCAGTGTNRIRLYLRELNSQAPGDDLGTFSAPAPYQGHDYTSQTPCNPTNFGDGIETYPKFGSNDGTSNSEIDLSRFYVLGGGQSVNGPGTSYSERLITAH